ncbi:MAG: hypothetical protein Ct9H300mP16_06660 [Pseudomonadota bacterium]|nr:MAG: hypothetical protein Ct9H300mP16_06660 [Pseudomonadota bacterium]
MDATGQDLDRFCLDNMTRFKPPKHYRFLQSLPKKTMVRPSRLLYATCC